jgi:UDP-N-acetylmuramoyl-tripeptide--D-alanyl-D-alanine ligase
MTPVFIPNLLASYQIYSILSAIAVGIHFDRNLVEISQYLKDYKVSKGRMNLIEGIKNSIIVDDTYNSSPDALSSAIKAVDNLYKYIQAEQRRKIFIVGDMLELGVNEKKAHEKIGEELAEIANRVILVGERIQSTKEVLLNNGFKEANILVFNNSEECANVISNQISEKDIILVKGSQGIRMEKVVKILMSDQTKAKELLVRQDEQWENK